MIVAFVYHFIGPSIYFKMEQTYKQQEIITMEWLDLLLFNPKNSLRY